MHKNIRNNKTLLIVAILLSFIMVYFICFKVQVHKFSGTIMGTNYNVTYMSSWWHIKPKVAIKAVHDAVADIDNRMSTYEYNSELMQFNHATVNQPFTISKDIIKLVSQAQELSELSEGAYDITVGPLVNLWGFGPTIEQLTNEVVLNNKDIIDAKKITDLINMQNRPSQEEIDKTLKKVGYKSIKIDVNNSTLTKTKDIFIDLSSIAKGYGVDQAALALDNLGINDYSVEIGGEIRVKGKNPNNDLWTIAILDPRLNLQYASAIVKLNNKSLASSGDYLNFFEYDGNRYSHAINSKTGYPKTSNIAEVTVIADNAYYADALSTMFMMLGDEIGIPLANKHNIAVYFVKYAPKNSKKEFNISYSDTFGLYLQQ